MKEPRRGAARARGRPAESVRLVVAPGPQHDLLAGAPYLPSLRDCWLLADRKFNADDFRHRLGEPGGRACMPHCRVAGGPVGSAVDSTGSARQRKLFCPNQRPLRHRHPPEKARGSSPRFPVFRRRARSAQIWGLSTRRRSRVRALLQKATSFALLASLFGGCRQSHFLGPAPMAQPRIFSHNLRSNQL